MQLPTKFYPPTVKLLPVQNIVILKITGTTEEKLAFSDPYTTPYSLTLSLANSKTFEINSLYRLIVGKIYTPVEEEDKLFN